VYVSTNCELESGWFESKRRKGKIGENVILVLLAWTQRRLLFCSASKYINMKHIEILLMHMHTTTQASCYNILSPHSLVDNSKNRKSKFVG